MNEENKNIETKSNIYNNQIKVIAVLGILIFLLIFLSLISFSPSDEQNAQVSVSDIFKLFAGDDELEAKASVTKNWLGLAGAKISDLFYNGTIGYYAFSFPLMAIYWLILVFLRKEITKGLIKYTIIFFLMGLFFSGFIGSLQNIEFLNTIPKEWSGSIGQFLSNIIVSIIGVFGSIVVFASGMVLVIYLSSEIRTIIDSKFNIKKFTIPFLSKIFPTKDTTKEEINNQDTENNSNSEDIDALNSDVINELDNNVKVINEVENTGVNSPNEGAKDNFDSIVSIMKSPKINIKKVFPEDEIVSIDHNPFEVSDKIKNEEAKIVNSENNFISAYDEINSPKVIEKEIIKDENLIINSDDENKKTLNFKFSKPEIKEPIKKETQNTNELESDKKELFKIAENPNYIIDKNELVIENNEFIDELNIVQPTIEKQETEKPIIQKQLKFNLKSTKMNDHEQQFQLSTAIHDEKIIYKNPSLNLLNSQSSQTNINQVELETNARILQEKLETFKIFIEDLTVTPGPVVTQYEFVPAPGIKISKIESLTDDLAMALKAKGIRIIAPIPGKGTIGVEIPNNNPSMVRFGEVINSNKFLNSNAKLPIAFGKTISGEVYVADLTKMPHLLIAGSTGSGKSVGVNTLITSLLYKMHPSELKFVIIDPKKVELRQYEGLAYHYMATSPDIEDIIVTKPEDAVIVLKAAVKEMELRYEILASAAQRNISDYNERLLNGTLKVKDDEIHRPMPYIVVIIDELADLMLTASKEIEEPITRLAQMARAVGIHLVIATQRPSVDVITGVIKANFPARIAYLVASKIDSRTILDMQGAEQLLGQGDMLFLPSGQPKPVRIQNAFISTEEVESVCEFIEVQKGYSEPYYLPTLLEKSSKGAIDPEDRDELFEDAARLIIRTQQGSVSLLQRRLKIGYARAGRIVDELESAGVVGGFDGSKARQVLMESESELEAVL